MTNPVLFKLREKKASIQRRVADLEQRHFELTKSLGEARAEMRASEDMLDIIESHFKESEDK